MRARKVTKFHKFAPGPAVVANPLLNASEKTSELPPLLSSTTEMPPETEHLPPLPQLDNLPPEKAAVPETILPPPPKILNIIGAKRLTMSFPGSCTLAARHAAVGGPKDKGSRTETGTRGPAATGCSPLTDLPLPEHEDNVASPAFSSFVHSLITADSGATHSFCNISVVDKLKKIYPDFILTPGTSLIKVADGRLVPELGNVQLTFSFGKIKMHWTFIVAELGPAFDLILGDDFMTKFGCILDYDKLRITMKRVPRYGIVNLRVRKVSQVKHLGAVLRSSRKFYEPLTAKQFCNDFKTGERMFLTHFTPHPLLNNPVLHERIQALDEPSRAAVHTLLCDSINHVKCDLPNDSIYKSLPEPIQKFLDNILLGAVGKYDNMTIEDKIQFAPEYLQPIIRKFIHVFDDLPDRLPPRRGESHKIQLVDGATPPKPRYYKLSPTEKREVEFQLNNLLRKGYVTPSHSPYGAPILFKDKPDGSFRMCIDFRALNKQTIKNRFPLPRMDDLLDMLVDAKYFTSLDLQQAYHQVQLLPEDCEKTAFVTHLGLYEYKVLCFGLANAPATFQSLMHNTLDGLLYKNVIAYLDDILIFSKTEKEHAEHVEQVLERLHKDEFYCRIWKCSFSQPSVKFLGWIIKDGTKSVDPAKIKIVEDWPCAH